jgi:hypothetical protein
MDTTSQEEEEDAAFLVDSFFLPGGILDPEDGDVDILPSMPPTVRRIPSNPWRDELFQDATAAATTIPNISIDVSRQEQKEKLLPNFLRGGQKGMSSSSAVSPKIIRPPPGYTESDRLLNHNNHAFVVPSPTHGTSVNNNNNYNNHTICNRLEENQIGLTSGPQNPPSPMAGFQDRTIRRPYQSLHSSSKQESSPVVGLLMKASPSTPEEIKPQRDAEVENKLFHVSSPQQHLKKKTEYTDHDDTDDDDDDDNDDDDNDYDDNDYPLPHTREDSNGSFPFDILRLNSMSKGESLTSSLSTSTSTCLDDAGDASTSPRMLDMEDDDDEEDDNDGLGGDYFEKYENDDNNDDTNERIHQQQYPVPEQVETNKLGSDPNGSDMHSQSHASSEATINLDDSPKSKANQSLSDFNNISLVHRCWSFIRWWILSAAKVASVLTEKCASAAVGIMRQCSSSPSLKVAFLRVDFQARKIASHIHSFGLLTIECIYIFEGLARRFRSLLNASFLVFMQSFLLLAFFILRMWKFALVESLEESSVTACYAIFYFLPKFCSLLMEFINLPHWTSHLLTTVAVYSMSYPVNPGMVYTGKFSVLELVKKVDLNGGSEPLDQLLSTLDDDVQADVRRRNERVCQKCLKILRYALPLVFFVGGFSSDGATAIGDSGASRLTTAFIMSLVRRNLVFSPIGWVSWAIQVLVTTYYPTWPFLDHCILVVGLSSIRLIRYIEHKRLKERKMH